VNRGTNPCPRVPVYQHTTMKIPHFPNLGPAIATLTLCFASALLPATGRAQLNAGGLMTLQMAGQPGQFGLANLIGKPVYSSNQEQLGTLADFLIEAPTGRVRYAVVPSGGDTFRLAPIAALEQRWDGSFALRLDRNQWDRVGTVTQAQLPERLNLSGDHQQRLVQQFSLAGQPGSENGHLEHVRATGLRGKSVNAGNQSAGIIEDVLIDVPRRTAAAVLKGTLVFATTEKPFVVPLSQLQFGSGTPLTLTTSLTQNDFVRARTAAQATAANTNAPLSQANAMPSASAIQQAVERHTSVARGAVNVIPESRLVLRGTVESEQKKAEVERAARAAAPGVRIDSEITVR
jgi:hypothetical protein